MLVKLFAITLSLVIDSEGYTTYGPVASVEVVSEHESHEACGQRMQEEVSSGQAVAKANRQFVLFLCQQVEKGEEL